MRSLDGDGLEHVRAGIAKIQQETLARGISIYYYIGERLVEHRPDGRIVDVKLPVTFDHEYGWSEDRANSSVKEQ